MGLVKPKTPPRLRAGKPRAGASDDLASGDPGERRRAARDLAQTSAGLSQLLAHLPDEPVLSVRAAILNALIEHRSNAVAEGLAPLLAHEDAGLRNGAIEALQAMPEEAESALQAHLASADADLRIFAVNVLALTNGETAAERLIAVLDADDHINVCAAAVEGLTEIGDEQALAALGRARSRFFDNDFMRFAIDMAVQQIEGR